VSRSGPAVTLVLLLALGACVLTASGCGRMQAAMADLDFGDRRSVESNVRRTVAAMTPGGRVVLRVDCVPKGPDSWECVAVDSDGDEYDCLVDWNDGDPMTLCIGRTKWKPARTWEVPP
jgi:hypothetical protein